MSLENGTPEGTAAALRKATWTIEQYQRMEAASEEISEALVVMISWAGVGTGIEGAENAKKKAEWALAQYWEARKVLDKGEPS